MQAEWIFKPMLFFRTAQVRVVATLLLVCSLCLVAGASVFKVVGRNWNNWVPTGSLPWEKAYQTAMVVNGKRVDLHVYATRYNQPASLQLKGVLESIGAQVKSNSSEDSGVATLNDYEVKYLVSSPPSSPSKYIFLSYSDPRTATSPDFPLPLYPNGQVLSTVSDLHTKTEYASLRTTATSTEVHEYYRQALTSDGWAQMKPCHVDAGESKGMAIYQRRGQICFIDIVPGKNISSTVTILVEKGN